MSVLRVLELLEELVVELSALRVLELLEELVGLLSVLRVLERSSELTSVLVELVRVDDRAAEGGLISEINLEQLGGSVELRVGLASGKAAIASSSSLDDLVLVSGEGDVEVTSR